MSMSESGAADEALQAMLRRLSEATARTRPVAGAARALADASTVIAPPSRPLRVPRPWLSASASLFVWGGGQWLNRQRPLAILFLSLQVLAISVFWCLSRTWEFWVGAGHLFFLEEMKMRAAIAAAGLLVPMTGVVGVLQAYLHAERSPGARAHPRMPLLPAFASGIVPGWGQILNSQLGKAVAFLSGWWFGLYLVAVAWLDPTVWTRFDPTGAPIAGLRLSVGALAALAVAGLTWVLSVYDAAFTSRRRES